MKQYLYSSLDGMLAHHRVLTFLPIYGLPRRLPRHLIFSGTHLYTRVDRGTVRVKCLAQELDTEVTASPTGSWVPTRNNLRWLISNSRGTAKVTSKSNCKSGCTNRVMKQQLNNTYRNNAHGINYVNFQLRIVGFQNMYPCSSLSLFWDDTWKVNRGFMLLYTSHLFPPPPHPRDIAGEFSNKRC